MPELPEVEVTRLGLLKYGKDAKVTNVEATKMKLRIPMPHDLREKLLGTRLADIVRRGKYMVIIFRRDDVGLSEAMSLEKEAGKFFQASAQALGQKKTLTIPSPRPDIELSTGENSIRPDYDGEAPARMSTDRNESELFYSHPETARLNDASGTSETPLLQPIKAEVKEERKLDPETPLSADEEQHIFYLLVHLGMSGWFCAFRNFPLPRHSHLILSLDNDLHLVFNDTRRFGVIDWCRKAPNESPLLDNWQEDYRLVKLGREPFDPKLSPEYMLEKAGSRQIPVKTFLMDHTIIVGLGNIYAAETLFAAQISPKLPVSNLVWTDWAKILDAARTTLTEAISYRGTTFKDFLSSEGELGGYFGRLRVYGRKGSNCFVCETPLIHEKLRGRATIFCPSCQANDTLQEAGPYTR